MIRSHLDAEGFRDVELRVLSGYPPAQTSVSAPLVTSAISAYRKQGITPSVTPREAGSAPYYVFTERLKLPMVMGGLGHGSGDHAPTSTWSSSPSWERALPGFGTSKSSTSICCTH